MLSNYMLISAMNINQHNQRIFLTFLKSRIFILEATKHLLSDSTRGWLRVSNFISNIIFGILIMKTWDVIRISNKISDIRLNAHDKTLTWYTGGMVRWLKKSSKEFNDTWLDMHLKSRWLKIRTINFSFIFSSKYGSRVFLPKWLTFLSSKKLRWLKIRIILLRIQFLSEFWAISVFSS